MSAKKENRTPPADRKGRVAKLRASGWPVSRIAEDVGVSDRTVRRWLTEPATVAAVAEIRQSTLTETLSALETVSRSAVTTLGLIMRDDQVPPNVRVRAALGVLSALPAIAAHADLDARIRALEAAYAPPDEE